MKEEETVYARIPKELHTAVKDEADAKGVSMSAIIRWAIQARYTQDHQTPPVEQRIPAPSAYPG